MSKHLMWEKISTGLSNPGRKGLLSAATGHPRGLWRAKIPGGWLVTVAENGDASGSGLATTFVPDPGHRWDGGSLS